DMLVAIINSALTSVEESREKLRAAADRQKSILLELLPDKPEITDKVIANIDKDQDAVEAMALAASQMRGVPPQMMELVAGLGEVWSAQTLCAYMNSAGVRCEWIDARDVLIVPDGPLS
ncbi:AKHSDH1, partial [Symbiodinium necroappetens]